MTDQWSSKHEQMISILWQRVCAQAESAGVKLPAGYSRKEVPSELAKTAFFTDVLKVLIEEDPSKHMVKQKNCEEYISKVLAPKLGWKKTSAVSAMKQNQLWQIPRIPPWTKLAASYPIEVIEAEANKVRNKMASADGWSESSLKSEFTEEPWKLKLHGLPGPLFLAGHAMTVAGTQVMPWSILDQRTGQMQDLPLPLKYYKQGARLARDRLNLNGFLRPAHLLIGSPNAGGRCLAGAGVVTVSNYSGAAGMPYPLMEDGSSLTTDGKRPTKGNVAYGETLHILRWLEAGCPWTGPLYDRLAQPNTMWRRGDAKVSYQVSALAEALLREGFPLLYLLMPGRGIVIVSTAQTLMELMFFKPYQELLTDADVRHIDLRTRRFTKLVIRGMLQSVLASDTARAIGADVERWDLNAYPGEHGVMAAFMASLYAPGEHEILVGSASRPALWTAAQVSGLDSMLSVGEYVDEPVEVPDPITGLTHVEQVRVTKVGVNFRKLIAQVYQMVHGSGVHVAGYDLPVVKSVVTVPASITNIGTDKGSESPQYAIHVHGAIRSGSGGTSSNNSNLNTILEGAAGAFLLETDVTRGLVRRRQAWFGLPALSRVVGYDSPGLGQNQSLYRGDDSVRVLHQKLIDSKGLELGLEEHIALEYALVGRFANRLKQRTGDYRVPELEFASESYDEYLPGGTTSTERTLNRVITSETAAGVDMLRPLREAELDKENFNLGLITETMSVKSRIAPQRGATGIGAPMGSPTPGNEHFIKLIAEMDKFGLIYGKGDQTLESVAALIESEAIRFALAEAKKHNLDDKVIDELIDDYKQAELHMLLFDLWDRRTDIGGRAKGAAQDSYEAYVASLKKGKKEPEV